MTATESSVVKRGTVPLGRREAGLPCSSSFGRNRPTGEHEYSGI